MLLMAMVVLGGLVAVILLTTVAHSRSAAQRAAVQADVEREQAAMARRGQEIDTAFVEHVLAGGTVDQGVTEYQRDRAVVLAGKHSDSPWRWGNDDLNAWKVQELRRRTDETSRRMLVPAVGIALTIVLVTVTVVAILYQHLEVRPPEAVPEAGALPSPLKPLSSPNNPADVQPPEGQP